MNISGKPLILNTKDVLKTVNAKLKIAKVENEKRYVNESGDTIQFLKILSEPVDDNDAVNKKYLEKKFNELDVEYKKKFEELDVEYKKKFEEFDIQEKKLKTGVEFLVKDLKGQIEKIKGDVSRHTVNELKILRQEIRQEITKQEELLEEHKKQFKLLDRNITIWYEKVEKRLQDSKKIVHKKA